MSIVTIARELGSWGDDARTKLAKALNARLLDKTVLEECLVKRGIAPNVIARYDERKPGFFSSFSSSSNEYLLILKSVLLEAAAAGDVLVIGRAGNILMEEIPSCLRVRLVAPMPVRVHRIMEQFKCSEEMAAKLVRQCDNDRDGFCDYHFNAKWSDPAQYDITINTAALSDEELVQMILALVKTRITPEREAEGRRLITRRKLAQEVLVDILMTKKIPLSFLNVEAQEDGTVILSGATSTPFSLHQAEAAAKEIPGVQRVENRIRVDIELTHGYFKP